MVDQPEYETTLVNARDEEEFPALNSLSKCSSWTKNVFAIAATGC